VPRYIQSLRSYLVSFTKRTQPLFDVETQQRDATSEFEKTWEEGTLEGWEDVLELITKGDATDTHGIWCAACRYFLIRNESVVQKQFTGQKMYSKQTVYDAHLTSKKHVKAAQKQAEGTAPPSDMPNGPSNGPTPSNTSSAKAKLRLAALQTYLATELLKYIHSAVADTKANVERRFSLTAREREQELLEQRTKPTPGPATKGGEGVNGAGEEEEEEERIYNPLKLPLGWDGKPIPYWLYKLHGLGVEYRCEICSDHVYMGRYVFALK
jgi:splicing factor 3A subunit 3